MIVFVEILLFVLVYVIIIYGIAKYLLPEVAGVIPIAEIVGIIIGVLVALMYVYIR